MSRAMSRTKKFQKRKKDFKIKKNKRSKRSRRRKKHFTTKRNKRNKRCKKNSPYKRKFK